MLSTFFLYNEWKKKFLQLHAVCTYLYKAMKFYTVYVIHRVSFGQRKSSDDKPEVHHSYKTKNAAQVSLFLFF